MNKAVAEVLAQHRWDVHDLNKAGNILVDRLKLVNAEQAGIGVPVVMSVQARFHDNNILAGNLRAEISVYREAVKHAKRTAVFSEMIENALSNGLTPKFKYQDVSGNVSDLRSLKGAKQWLSKTEGAHCISGVCSLRNRKRTFRIDRMTALVIQA